MSNDKFLVKKCLPEDADMIYDFVLEHFLEDEYLNCAIGYKRSEVKGFLNEYIKSAVRTGVSVKCTDKDSGELVGCRVSCLKDCSNTTTTDTSNYSWKEKAILDIMDVLYRNINELVPEATKFLSFEAMAVRSDYRRKGLAMGMIEENIRIGREAGCTHVSVAATNIRSQKLFEKLGFQKLKEMKYCDYLFEGKPVFAGYEDGFGTDGIMLFAKKI